MVQDIVYCFCVAAASVGVWLVLHGIRELNGLVLWASLNQKIDQMLADPFVKEEELEYMLGAMNFADTIIARKVSAVMPSLRAKVENGFQHEPEDMV